jgi:SET domain-containing protein
MEKIGNVYLKHQLPDPNHPALLQVGPESFIGPSGGIDDQFRHHCQPNCAVRVAGNRAIFYSLYKIMAGSELTFDYALTSTDTLDDWQMKCQCDSYNCREIISGHQYMHPDDKEKYKNKGLIPLYIERPDMILKSF